MKSFKQENQRKTVLLFILFPVILYIISFIIFGLLEYENFILIGKDSFDIVLNNTNSFFWIIIIWCIIRWIICYFREKNIIFNLSWAKELKRSENPELYNIVENICISNGIPMPKIAIMEEDWMNAFALWIKPKESWIAFTRWLLKNLNKSEVEAVAGHELTHILNKDCLLSYFAVVYIWVFSLVWSLIFNISRNINVSKKHWKFVIWAYLFWLAFTILWYTIYPLIRLAVSRKREYLADLWSVELTHDNQAMISALRKISWNPNVNKVNEQLTWFLIADPSINNIWNYAQTKRKSTTSILDTHPSIEDRIAKLEQYIK